MAKQDSLRDDYAVSKYIYGPPTDGKPFKLAMGLRSLDSAEWLEGGEDVVPQLNERNALLNGDQSTLYCEVEGFSQEIQSFIDQLIQNIATYQSDEYLITPSNLLHIKTGFSANLLSPTPLLEMTRVIAEDLCILKKIDGEWILVAGAVLFPSRWILSEKIGKSLDQIHAPVPGYSSGLAPYMKPTFDKITPERAVWRKNWSLHSTSELHQPQGIHTYSKPEEFWWRTERQTLTRSPTAESILFTIRNRAEPLRWIMDRPDEAQAFAQTLASMTPETIEYKGLTRQHQEIVRALMLAP